MARRVKLSQARKAVDSTFRKLLNYTAEIILSIILLVLICIPLGFVVPMWFQFVVLGRPRTELALDPVRWFGIDGAFWLILLLSLVSFFVAYVFILRLKPGVSAVAEPKEVEEEKEEDEPSEDEEEEEEEIEEVEEEEIEEEEVEEEEDVEEEEEEEEIEEVEDE